MNQQIKEVPGYNGRYGVTENGEVYSKAIRGNTKLNDEWRPHKIHTNSKGYKVVNLRLNGSTHQRKVHHLVLETFIGPRPNGHVACHRNDNKEHNTVQNLYWGLPHENTLDAIRNGRTIAGERHPNAKLTDSLIPKIRELFRSGVKVAEIADALEVTYGAVWKVVKGQTWRHA